MAYILYDQGKKIGEISGWVMTSFEPTYKNVLGKTILAAAAKSECTFVSPKPVNRKSKLVVIQDGKQELTLQVKAVKGATFVTAVIVSQKEVS